MEALVLWRSFPRPCKKAVVTAIKTQKQLWNFKPFKRSSLPILRFVKKNPKVEKFIQSELTGSLITSILGDDPFVYTQCCFSVQQLAMRLLFQSIMRDLYIIRLAESVIHLQHALMLEKFVHTVLPLVLTIIHIFKS